jgi:hypothetical protein
MMGDTWRQHYEGYEGLLHVLKLPRLNSLLTPPQPMSSSYLLKVYRRRLVLDPLHTPPEQGSKHIASVASVSQLRASSSCFTAHPRVRMRVRRGAPHPMRVRRWRRKAGAERRQCRVLRPAPICRGKFPPVAPGPHVGTDAATWPASAAPGHHLPHPPCHVEDDGPRVCGHARAPRPCRPSALSKLRP